MFTVLKKYIICYNLQLHTVYHIIYCFRVEIATEPHSIFYRKPYMHIPIILWSGRFIPPPIYLTFNILKKLKK
jgi:hypothetical protein